MAGNIIEIAELQIDVQDAISKAAKLGAQLDDLKKRKKELNKEDSDYQEQLAVLNAEIDVTNKMWRNSNSILSSLTAQKNTELGTIEKLELANKGLNASQKQLNLETEDGINKSTEYNEAIDKNTASIKGNSSATKQQAMNIGNYKSDILSALKETDGFNTVLESTTQVFIDLSKSEGGVKGLWSSMTEGIGSATKSALKFIATPIGAVIAVIVAGISLITAAIKGNQDSADTFGKAWAGVKAVIDVVIGSIVKLGTGLVSIIKGDFTKGIKQMSSSFDGMSESIKSAYEQGVKLKTMEIELEKQHIKSTQTINDYNKKITQANNVLADGTKSLQEQNAANMALAANNVKIADERIKLAKMQMAIDQQKYDMAIKNGAGENRELLKTLSESKTAVQEAENEKTRAIGEASAKRNEIRNTYLQRELDYIVDGYDSFKTMNEKIVNDDFQSMDQRTKTLEMLRQKSDESYRSMIQKINEFSGSKLDADKLLAESDEKRLAKMVQSQKISDENAGRVLEAVKERRAAIGDFYDAENTLKTKEAENQVARMELELLKIKEANTVRIKEDEAYNKALFERQRQSAINEADSQANIYKTQLDNKLITQNEYDTKTYQNGLDLKNKLYDLDEQFRVKEIQREKEVADINYANQVAAQSLSFNDKLEFQRQNNKRLQDEEIKHANKVGADVSLINKKYQKIDRDLTMVTQKEKLGLYSDFANNISVIAGKNTQVGKFAAAAAATINTYQAATGAYASLASIPYVGPALGIAAAAAATVAGFEAVQKIYAVDTTGSGSSSTPSSSTTTTTPAANISTASSVGQGIVSRGTESIAPVDVKPQSVLIMSDVEAKQQQINQSRKIGID